MWSLLGQTFAKRSKLSTLSERFSESIHHTKYCGHLEKVKDKLENRFQDFKKVKINLAMFSDPLKVDAETGQGLLFTFWEHIHV